MRAAGTVAALVLATLVLAPARARAHGQRGATVDIIEQPSGDVLVTLTAVVVDATLAPQLDGCALGPLGAAAAAAEDVGLARAWRGRCPHGLDGVTVSVVGLGAAISEAVVRVQRTDGTTVNAVLTAGSRAVRLTGPPARLAVARAHVGLGLRHILTGVDHLLFLVLLVLYAGELRAVIMAESAFALSHGLTFAATSLGWLQVASAPAEACIALSLVLLALDVGDPARRPPRVELAALAFGFGAIHGLGFAGGLRELGAPDAHAAWALVGFGLGVELGQLAFVLAVAAVVSLLRRIRLVGLAQHAVAYGAGALATAWFIQRALVSLGLEVS
ncbi:MAG: HupE/UreJ family protein [Kofleriaceae bacterium]